MGLTTWSYAGEFYDVEITGENVPYPEAAIVPESNVTGAGEVTFDKAAYASGDTVTVTFTPGEGMQVSEVYVNGINRFGLVSGNTLVLENFTEDFLVVRAEFVRAAEGTGTYTGTVSGYRNGATNVLEGAEVRLKDADAFDESVNVGADGTFSFADVPFGNYVLTVNMPGYSEYSEKVSFSGDMTSDVTLAWDFANIVSGSADLSGMNDENHAIGINAWGSMVQLTLDDGMARGRYRSGESQYPRQPRHRQLGRQLRRDLSGERRHILRPELPLRESVQPVGQRAAQTAVDGRYGECLSARLGGRGDPRRRPRYAVRAQRYDHRRVRLA